MACLPEDRAQSEPQRQQIETRLAERHHNLHPRAHVALQLPQPQDVNRAHFLSSSHCLLHEFLYNSAVISTGATRSGEICFSLCSQSSPPPHLCYLPHRRLGIRAFVT
jgi:hypothetical protein